MAKTSTLKVFETTYDGFIVVNNNGNISTYEGNSLCPSEIQEWLKHHNPKKIHEFVWDAISYGLCD